MSYRSIAIAFLAGIIGLSSVVVAQVIGGGGSGVGGSPIDLRTRNATVNGNATIGGTLDVTGVTTLGDTDTSTLDVAGAATVGGQLDVGGQAVSDIGFNAQNSNGLDSLSLNYSSTNVPRLRMGGTGPYANGPFQIQGTGDIVFTSFGGPSGGNTLYGNTTVNGISQVSGSSGIYRALDRTSPFTTYTGLYTNTGIGRIYFNDGTGEDIVFIDKSGLTIGSGNSLAFKPYTSTDGHLQLFNGDLSNGYALGVEPNTLYSRANVFHRWYLGTFADDGASDAMELSSSALTLHGFPIKTGGCATGYTRIAPNFCLEASPTIVALARDACTAIPIPSGATALLLKGDARAYSANGTANRFTGITVYNDTTCTSAVSALAAADGYEWTAVTGRVVQKDTATQIVSSTNLRLQMTDDGGNQGGAYYSIVGYFD